MLGENQTDIVQSLGIDNPDLFIAQYLLDHKLYLSALEYYFEQLERGVQIGILQKFFSNSNFANNLNSTSSTPSVFDQCPSYSSFDSLDIGQMSDEGNVLEEKLKVLEYELRKKNDEIHELRNELNTLVTGGFKRECREACKETDTNTQLNSMQCVMPHEMRAIAYLVNQYLLEQNYRLTAIHFAEESEANRFYNLESWDDLIVNLRRPENLFTLLKFYWYSDCTDHQSYDRFSNKNSTLSKDVCIQTSAAIRMITNNDGNYIYSSSEMKKNQCINTVDNVQQVNEIDANRIMKFKINQLEKRNARLVSQAQSYHNQLTCLGRIPKSTLLPTNDDRDDDGDGNMAPVSQFDETLGTDSLSNSNPENLIPSIKVPDKDQIKQFELRSTPESFMEMIATILPPDNSSFHVMETNFHFAYSLDEFVQFTHQQLDNLIPLLTDEAKVLILPLLIQLICLEHCDSARCQLLNQLFDLFSADSIITDLSATTTTIDDDCKSDLDHFMQNSYFNHLLKTFQTLASRLGPDRLDSELLPQLWSQFTQLSTTDFSKLILLISICGVIAKFIPAHLKSPVIMNILESCLDCDKYPAVIQAIGLRSLACAVTTLTDVSKLPDLVAYLLTIVKQYCPTSSQLINKLITINNTNHSTDVEGQSRQLQLGIKLCSNLYKLSRNITNPIYEIATQWLLPALAQWCLELNSLHSLFTNELLDVHHDNILDRDEPNISSNAYTIILHLNLLHELVPFIHAWLLLSTPHSTPVGDNGNANKEKKEKKKTQKKHEFVKSNTEEQTVLNCCISETANATELSVSAMVVEFDCDVKFVITCPLIIGSYERYQCLNQLLLKFCQSIPRIRNVSPARSIASSCQTDDKYFNTTNVSTAKVWFDDVLVSKLIQLLENTPNLCDTQLLQASIALLNLENEIEFEVFVQHHLDKYFVYPFMESLESERFMICVFVCHLIVRFRKSFGLDVSHSLLTPHFQSRLMKPTEHGNYEFNNKSMQTGLLAGYCCLLSSHHSKSELSKVKTLLTSAVFLHAREAFPLQYIQLAMWCICVNTDFHISIKEILLPALHPCVNCVDSRVRRASCNLMHCLIEIMRFMHSFTNTTHNVHHSWIELIELVWPLISQLTRDDFTGQQRRHIIPEQADWSVLCVSLGLLNSFLLLVVCIAHSQNTNELAVISMTKQSAVLADSIDSVVNEYKKYRCMTFELLSKLYNLTIGQQNQEQCDATKPPPTNIDYCMHRVIISQHRFWRLLVCALLDLTNRLLPISDEHFQCDHILPWLFNVAEMNNSLPDLEERLDLANRLVTVFSTAVYSVQNEKCQLQWLIPGLDRIRLDLVESGDNRRVREVEQFLQDVYNKIRPVDSDTKPTQPNVVQSTPTGRTKSHFLSRNIRLNFRKQPQH